MMQPRLEKATRQHTKNHNSQLVLRTIYGYGEISRADLARLTHLTRTTVSEVVANLIEQGLVEEIGHGPSMGGRSPILLRVPDDSRHLIGINLANSAMHGAIINLRGEIRHRISRPFPKQGGEAMITQVYAMIDELIAATSSTLLGIGVSTPGLVDTSSGVIRHAVNLGWRDFPLRQLLQDRYHIPTYIANDSHALALAEYTFGDSKHVANLIAIKLGDGIGAGIILNGHLFYGDGYGAGEIGHVVVVENGQPCRCGNNGCLETVANNRAILRRARELALRQSGSHLHQRALLNQPITIELLQQAIDAGDPIALQVLDETGRYLGIAIANMIGILNVQRILITGQHAVVGETLRQAVIREMHKRALPALAEHTVVEMGGLSHDSVLLGASALLLMYELDLVRIGRPQPAPARNLGRVELVAS